MNYDKIQNLPITPFLDEICRTLKASPSRFLVLTAQTAAGKSTAVPLALLNNFEGKILMLEPRRLAAVAIAGRVAELLDEDVGQTSGYVLHLEKRTSSSTRFEVMTEAILTRRLQNDPGLEGVNVVVLDEFHERSIHADLALAFLKEAMSLRNDLYVILMSATMDARRIADYLSEPASPVMEIPGRQFPVTIEYDDKATPAQAVLSELNRKTGTFSSDKIPNERSVVNNRSLVEVRNDTILCFLPGIYEINKTKTALEEHFSGNSEAPEVLVLHSSIPLSDQKKILSPVPSDQPRRIILSSAIAETSLTVPGVTTVIDSGLARLNKMNVALGMEQLVTEKVSQFSADQRAGRAGRLMPGRCIRLWNKFDQLNKEVTPEILRTNLSQLVLECAQWGAKSPSSLSWLDTPSEAAWKTSADLLEQLGFILTKEDALQITEDGGAALTLGLSPRLACSALYGLKTKHLNEALDFVLKFSEYSQSSVKQQEKFTSNLKNRLEKINLSNLNPEGVGFSKAGLLLSGFPDRLAKKETSSSQDKTVYQFTSGRKAYLQKPANLCPEWLVAPEVNAGDSIGKIWSYEEISAEDLEPWLNEHTETVEKAYFAEDGKKLKKSRLTLCGHLVLKEVQLQASPEDFKEALCNQIMTSGFECLPVDDKIINLLTRAAFFIKNGATLNKANEQAADTLCTKLENLTSTAENWLLPFLTGNKIDSKILYDALYYFLEGSLIDEKVPLVLMLKNGKKGRISYENKASGTKLTIDSLLTNVRSLDIQPVLEIIIQQIFGCFETPRILGVPILLKLLSPARRPLQITDDLEHFWTGAWIEICREMKGRYPKHNWDYRVSEE